MSDTAVQEAPTQQAPPPSAPRVDSSAGLREAMAAHIAQSQGGAQQATAQEVSPQKVQADAQQASSQAAAEHQEQQETAKPSGDGKPKPWDKLGKPPEKKTEQQPEEYGDKPPEGDKAQTAWTGIKKRVKEYETKEQQWAREKAEYEQKVKDYEARTAEFKPEILDEYKKYKENEAIDFVHRTPDYIEKADKPFREAEGVLSEISEYTGLDMRSLKEALMNPNSILRDEGVLALMETSKKEMSDARKEALKNRVIEAGDKMNRAAAEHQRMMAEATQKKEQRDLAQKASDMQAKEQAAKVFKAAVSEIRDGMKASLADLIEDGTFKAEDLDFQDMQVSQDPMDNAFAEYSANLLPVVMRQLRETKAKLAQAEADRKARQNAQPGVKPGRSNGSPSQAPSLHEAMQQHLAGRREGGGYF